MQLNLVKKLEGEHLEEFMLLKWLTFLEDIKLKKLPSKSLKVKQILNSWRIYNFIRINYFSFLNILRKSHAWWRRGVCLWNWNYATSWKTCQYCSTFRLLQTRASNYDDNGIHSMWWFGKQNHLYAMFNGDNCVMKFVIIISVELFEACQGKIAEQTMCDRADVMPK